ncbi:MAG: hypothetical protein A2798_03515 [Candidatus Levybacteria bacterium RIFCSPHIGHO2_01_FULL_37_17]|nr:MAG: hypothetical protein A2798_03515 [Candidatus Levybacteria bacterium RIFCSPHIGHO2_01_FULL_37_17]OGH36544.1 MAG: hypothetical protein A2959_03570 [Candidatus Levybacteria bacterium RIFCSPLOWO2_01_FULL_38_23]
MKKLFTLISVFAFAVLLFNVQSVSADCTTIYGGGQSCPPSYNFDINKLVQTPGKGGGTFVDNLSVNDPKYSPKQNVTFKLTVKNTGDKTIPTLTVVDTFPSYLSFVSGAGNYNSSNRTLTFTISNLEAGKSQEFTVVGKLSDENMMPSDQATICLVNYAQVSDNSTQSNDSSQFCVQKQVLGKVFPAPKVVTTPPTGPEMVTLVGLIPAALAGFALRKKFTFRGGEK